MTPEEIREAYAKIKNTKHVPDPQYLRVDFHINYNTLLIPHKEGLALLTALEHAEIYDGRYDQPPTLERLSSEITYQMFTGKEYQFIRQAMLLNIPVEELKKALTP